MNNIMSKVKKTVFNEFTSQTIVDFEDFNGYKYYEIKVPGFNNANLKATFNNANRIFMIRGTRNTNFNDDEEKEQNITLDLPLDNHPENVQLIDGILTFKVKDITNDDEKNNEDIKL